MDRLTVTPQVQHNREKVADLATALMEVPPDVRHLIASFLRDHTPQEIDNEALGYALSAVCGSLILLAGYAVLGGEDPDTLVNRRLLIAMCSASEELITDGSLQGVL